MSLLNDVAAADVVGTAVALARGAPTTAATREVVL